MSIQEDNDKTFKTSLPHYYTAQEASEFLGFTSNSYLSRLCRDGKITAYKVGSYWLIPEEQVELLKTQRETLKK